MSIDDIKVLCVILILYFLLRKKIARWFKLFLIELHIEMVIFMSKSSTEQEIRDIRETYTELIEHYGLYYLYNRYPDFFTKE